MASRMQVAVVGAGRMGAGIAASFAAHGHDLTVVARSQHKARSAVEQVLEETRAYGVWTDPACSVGAIRYVAAPAAVPPQSDLVLESVSESWQLKVALLHEIGAAAPNAVLASNTSSFSITALADAAGSPERAVGLHFWYPAQLMPLVEVVRGEHTLNAAVDLARHAVCSIGKTPIDVRRDVPGQIWNRLQIAVLREALALVTAGVADPDQVDLVVREGLARRWARTGPFESAVLGGTRTFETVARNLLPELSDARNLDGLAAVLESYVKDPAALDKRRNDSLARALARERDGG
jgi:3-hydroxybutyryl-CoA dehydrogenase